MKPNILNALFTAMSTAMLKLSRSSKYIPRSLIVFSRFKIKLSI
jgi:hypothetical protein